MRDGQGGMGNEGWARRDGQGGMGKCNCLNTISIKSGEKYFNAHY